MAGQRPTATDLPQTNDSTTGWSWIGAMLLTILSWLGLANHRRQG
ncbi:LPXTG cell wall anchor domain-containing protein [Levilactobacillus senmaizukei]|nr:LPXTG cell wall anchor domain-containing protein [Levilactobacillus senmaizukei]